MIGVGIDSGLVAHWHLHWVIESVSDSGYGHENIPCMTYNIHVDIFTWMCMDWFDHCMSTQVGSNPCRRLSLLGFAHPVVGPPFIYRSGAGG